MKLIITGVHGFIGRHLAERLTTEGYILLPVNREVLLAGDHRLTEWVRQADAVVNLAGESIAGRWTSRKKKEIKESRSQITRNLVKAVREVQQEGSCRIKLFASASAVGIYPAGEVADEYTTGIGKGFLAQVATIWEEEVRKLEKVRWVIFRLGVVVGNDGGIAKKMNPLVRSRIALIFGNGEQPFPVVRVEEVVDFLCCALKNQEIQGIYNLVGSLRMNYRQFVDFLAGGRPPWLYIRIPKFVLRWLLGEAQTMFTDTADVRSVRKEKSGESLCG